MDLIDRKIIAELQRDATTPIAQIADRVGLSQTPCWKRIQKLEQAGTILGRIAVVDPVKVGLGLTVFVEVVALDHTEAWRDRFVAVTAATPEVMEVFRLAGETGYLLRIMVSNMKSYDRIYRELTDALAMKSVTSKFVMERMHAKAALPEPHVEGSQTP